MREAVTERPLVEVEGHLGGTEEIKLRLDRLDERTLQATNKEIEKLPPEVQDLLGREERGLLALIDKKDQATFSHSLAVAETASMQLEEFGGDLDRQGMPREAFLRAALLHDVGKLSLPDCILKGSMTWRDFEEKFFELKNTDFDFINHRLLERGLIPPGSSVGNMSDNEIRAMKVNYRDYVTLDQCYSDDKDSLEEIRKYNIDPSAISFMDALRLHETASSQLILQMENIPDGYLVAELAGSHHNYSREKDEQYHPAKEVLRVTVLASELLHLADVYQAIRQSRPYKQKHSHIEAMYIIMQEAQEGRFDVGIVKRWLRKILPSVKNADESEKDKLEKLAYFLEE